MKRIRLCFCAQKNNLSEVVKRCIPLIHVRGREMCLERKDLQPSAQNEPLCHYKKANADRMLVDQELSTTDLPSRC